MYKIKMSHKKKIFKMFNLPGITSAGTRKEIHETTTNSPEGR